MPEAPRDKICRKCGQVKPIWFFPKDRSRPDGHWHTCRACNRQYWHQRGKLLAIRRKYDKEPSRSGLQGLREYRHGGPRFSSLAADESAAELRFKAEQLLSKYLVKHAHRMTRALRASLHACAASHAPHVGNRAWGLSMRAKKGWATRRRKQAQQDACLTEIRARNAGKARVSYGLEGV